MAMELQSFRDLPARLLGRRPVPDAGCDGRRGRAVLYSWECCRGYRLRVHQPLCARDPEPRHRTGIRVSGSQRGIGSRPHGQCEGRCAAEAGSCRLRPSLRRGSRHGFRAPQLSDDRRRALRRSSRCGLCLQGQRDETRVRAACGRWRELAISPHAPMGRAFARPIGLSGLRRCGTVPAAQAASFSLSLSSTSNSATTWS